MYLAPFNERIRVFIIIGGLFAWINALAIAWQREDTDSICAQVQWGRRDHLETGWDVVYNVKPGAERHRSQLLSRRLELGDSVKGGHIITEHEEITDGLPANLHFKIAGNKTTISDLPVFDFYVLSDISEIPVAQSVEAFGRCVPPGPVVTLHLDSYFYDYGCREKSYSAKKKTFGTFLGKRSYLLKTCPGLSISDCVEKLKSMSPAAPSVINAGYRLTYLTEDIVKKSVPQLLLEEFDDLFNCMRLKCLHPVIKSIQIGRSRPQRLATVGPRKTAELIFKQVDPFKDLITLYKPILLNTTIRTCTDLSRRIRDAAYIPNKTTALTKPNAKEIQEIVAYSKALLRSSPRDEPPCYSCVYYIFIGVLFVIGLLCSCFRC